VGAEKTTIGLRPNDRTCTWTITSRPNGWPSTCDGWTPTTTCTTSTSGGKAPVSLSIRSSFAGCARCCTTTVRRPNTTGTSTTGGEVKASATTPCRGGGSSSRLPKPANRPSHNRRPMANSVYRGRRPRHSTISRVAGAAAGSPASRRRRRRNSISGDPVAPLGRRFRPPRWVRRRLHGRKSGNSSQHQRRHRRHTYVCRALHGDDAGVVGRTFATGLDPLLQLVIVVRRHLDGIRQMHVTCRCNKCKYLYSNIILITTRDIRYSSKPIFPTANAKILICSPHKPITFVL